MGDEDLYFYKNKGAIFNIKAFILVFLRTKKIVDNIRVERPSSYRIYGSSGEIFGISHNYISKSLDEVSYKLICSDVVKYEDKRFYSHFGIDPVSIVRAFWENLKRFKIVQGGGTITQQLVRGLYLGHDRSLYRKLAEMYLAVMAERVLTKDEILRAYCSLVTLGPGLRGFQSASFMIFRKRVSSLTDLQRSALVGLLRGPFLYYPREDAEKFYKRAKLVHSNCYPNSVPSEVKDHDFRNELNVIDYRGFYKKRQSIIIDSIVSTVDDMPASGVKDVEISIDRKLQKKLDNVARRFSLDMNVESVSVVVLDISSGDVLAESAFSDGSEMEFSPSFHGHIQPGSTYKPFAVLAALSSGMDIDNVFESGLFTSRVYGSRDEPWKVRNYLDLYRGDISIKEALRFSDNSVFARISEFLSLEEIKKVYTDFGLFPGDEVCHPSIVLGSIRNGVSLIDLASAYSAIARGGVFKKARYVRFFSGKDKSFSYFPQLEMDLNISYEIVDILRSALLDISPFSRFGVAGKTGTAWRNSLYSGFSNERAFAVLVRHKTDPDEGDSKSVSALKVVERMIRERVIGGSDMAYYK